MVITCTKQCFRSRAADSSQLISFKISILIMIATRHGLGSVRPRIVYIDVRSTMTQSGLEDVVVVVAHGDVVVAHGDVVVAQTQPGPGGAILTDYIIL